MRVISWLSITIFPMVKYPDFKRFWTISITRSKIEISITFCKHCHLPSGSRSGSRSVRGGENQSKTEPCLYRVKISVLTKSWNAKPSQKPILKGKNFLVYPLISWTLLNVAKRRWHEYAIRTRSRGSLSNMDLLTMLFQIISASLFTSCQITENIRLSLSLRETCKLLKFKSFVMKVAVFDASLTLLDE